MVPQLVTQLDLDAPLVVVVGTSCELRTSIARAISAMGLQVIVCSESETDQVSIQESFTYAYKVVWIISPLDYFSQATESAKILMYPHAKKTVIVQPLLEGGTTQSSSVFGETWKKISSLQHEVILDINAFFETSLFIFGKNILGTGLFPLDLMSQHAEKNCIYDPSCELSVVSIDSFAHTAVPYFFKPSPQQSYCFSGTPVHSSEMVHEAIHLFRSYFQLTLVAKREPVEITASTPFQVSEVRMQTDQPLQLVDVFVRNWKQTTAKNNAFNAFIAPARPAATKPVVTVVEEPLQTQPRLEEQHAPPLEEETHITVEYSQQVQTTSNSQVVENQLSTTVTQTHEVLEPATKKTLQPPEPLDISSELSRIFKEPRTAVKVTRVENMASTEIKQSSKSKRKRVLFYGGLGFIGVGVGCVTLIAVFLATQFLLKQQLLAVAKATVHQQVDTDQWSSLNKTASFLEIQSQTYGSVLDLAVISEADHLVAITKQLSEVAFLIDEMDTLTQNLFYRLMGQDEQAEGTVFELAAQLSSQAETAYENLSLVTVGIDQISFGENNSEKETLVTAYQGKIKEMRDGLLAQRQILPLMQDIFGGTKKTYLVLFQNEQELRPTGGFIQAAALVTFSEGRLIATQVFSSYDVDALVSGEVAPPEDLAQYLGEQQWYFRDSNWNPDFGQAAAKAAWFMSKAAGGKIDGVVALTLASTGEMIDALGPLDVPEHNEIVTSKNLNALMEHHSEKLLVKGSTEKAYSVLILERLLDKVKTAQPEKIVGFLKTVHTNLEKNTLLVSSTDAAVQELMTTLRWTGTLIKPECPTQFSSDICTVDTIAQVAANTGVNKANYYLKENIDHTVELLPGVAQHTRTIRIENTATINAWPKGDYRAYYRFYLNANAQVSQVVINNKKLSKSEMTQRIEQGRSMVGFLVTVPIEAQTEIVLQYSVPLSGEAGYSYALFDQKQPGTAIPTTITIVPYSGLRPAKIAPQAEITPDGIVFETENRNSHGFYGVEFR